MLDTPNFLAYAAARRLNSWDHIPTLPTAEQIAARYHVAVLTWNAPVMFSKDGAERTCWAIVTHDRNTAKIASHTGETNAITPMAEIVNAIVNVVRELDHPSWVAVSKKRVLLAAALERQRISVTRG